MNLTRDIANYQKKSKNIKQIKKVKKPEVIEIENSGLQDIKDSYINFYDGNEPYQDQNKRAKVKKRAKSSSKERSLKLTQKMAKSCTDLQDYENAITKNLV